MSKDKSMVILRPDDIIQYYKMRYYNGSIWYLHEGMWLSLDQIKVESHKTALLNSLIYDVYANEATKTGQTIGKKLSAATVIGDVIKNFTMDSVTFEGIVFLNGYVNNQGFVAIEPGDIVDKLPFTTTQIKSNYRPYNSKDSKETKVVKKWLARSFKGDKEQIGNFLMLSSYALSNKTSGVFTFAIGNGNDGKSEWFNKINDIVGMNNGKKVTSWTLFGNNGSRFSLRNISNKSMLWLDEFIKKPSQDTVNTIKYYTNPKGTLEFENKGSNEDSTPNTHSWYSAANHIPQFKDMDDAFKRRIVFFNFTFPNLSEEEIDVLYGDKVIPYITTLLVNAYVKALKIKSVRNDKFINEETKELFKVIAKKDPITEWINGNHERIQDKPMKVILNMFWEDTRISSNSTVLGTKLKAEGYQKIKKTIEKGKRKELYSRIDMRGAEYAN